MKLPLRWPTKPPTDSRCDMSVGTGSDSLGSPIVYRCPNDAVETVLLKHSVVKEGWVCIDCAIYLDKIEQAYRNPRRKS